MTVLPIHAVAFVTGERGVAVTGPSRSGKTGALLAFMARGARYVASEWVHVDADGLMRGVVEPVRVRHHNLVQLNAPPPVGPVARLRLAALGAAAAVTGRGEGRRFVDVAPHQLGAVETEPWPLHHLVLLTTGEPGALRRLGPDEVVDRLAALLTADVGVDMRARVDACARGALRGTRVVEMVHPYPPRLDALHDQLAPTLTGRT